MPDRRRTSAALVCAALVSAGASCPSAAPPPRAYREVTAGCAGGFTGGGDGTALLADGKLFRWQRARAGAADARTLVRTDTALAAEVARRIGAMRFLEIEHTQPGNMTCFVRVRADSTEHEVSWPSSDTGAPKAVRELFDRLQAASR